MFRSVPTDAGKGTPSKRPRPGDLHDQYPTPQSRRSTKIRRTDNLEYYEDIYGTRIEGAFDETHDTGSDDDESPSSSARKVSKASKREVRPSKKRKLSTSKPTQEQKGGPDTDDAVSTGVSVTASVDSQNIEAAAKRLHQRQTVDQSQQTPFGRRGRRGRMTSNMAAPTSFDEPTTLPAHSIKSGAFTETNSYIHGSEPVDDDARYPAADEAVVNVQGQEAPGGPAATSASINMSTNPLGDPPGLNNGNDGQARGDGHLDDVTAEVDVVFDEDPGYAGDAEEVKQEANTAASRGDGARHKKSNEDGVCNDSREQVYSQPTRRGRPRKVESLAKELGPATSASEASPAGSRHNTRAEKKRVEALERERLEIQRLAARPKTRGFQQGHTSFFAKFSQPKEKGKGREVVVVKSKRNKMTARQATLHTKAKKGIVKRMGTPKAKHVKRLNWKGEQMHLVKGQGHVVVPRG
ncbi:hypothetical protein KC327_g17034 [Hortaea werneckii]|nr:hypothetical protein KC358_g18632 [Hortaea werneckii]KAI6795907.1 hypothetical protein KC350_g16937 [Hortaea werneckii]KAI6899666.1 hypothetical protein KC348_g17067 [Hortaea werneckii]KAI6919833.1 hypothetical protein KC341_g17020 [Hortaea werneckii]KAI6953355.1 hypothetical protein KC321_g17014 [Hortaea werneckii]